MRLLSWLRPLAARLTSHRTRTTPPRRPAFRPRVEGLEDRLTPSSGGLLDPTFGSGGIVTSSFSSNFDIAKDVLVQPDGKIVAAGWTRGLNTSTAEDFLVARYNVNGTQDTTFGSGGRTVTDFNSKGANAVADRGEAVALSARDRR